MSKQPKALLLANILEHQIPSIDCLEIAAKELRRLHQANHELVEALDWCVAEIGRDSPACVNGRNVLIKHKEQA